MNPSLEIIKSIYTKEDIEMFRVKNIHSSSLWGIIKVKHDIIFNINGFPNDMWGWGIEDRALYFRCRMKNINITNNPNQSFKIMQNTTNVMRYTGEKELISNMWRQKYIDSLDDKQKEEIIMVPD